jgi:hypothetical protein
VAAWTTDGQARPRARELHFEAEAQLKSFNSFGCTLEATDTYQDVREISQSGVAFERPPTLMSECWISTDRAKPVWVEGGGGVRRHLPAGPLEGQTNYGVNATVAMRVHPAAETRVDLAASRTGFGARWVDDDGAGTYRFAELLAPSWSVTLRQSLVLTPRLTLQAYAQLFTDYASYGPYYSARAQRGGLIRNTDLVPGDPFAGQGHAWPDGRETVLNVNVVLRWEYRLGSTLFLVYSRAQADAAWTGEGPAPSGLWPRDLAHGPTTDTIMAKWTWLWTGRGERAAGPPG